MERCVTKKWLENKGACETSFDYVCENGYIGLTPIKGIEKLIENDRLLDANWYITKVMNKKQNVKYAIFAAKQVIDIYEKNI